jgi:transposase InsO family protein
MPWRLLSVPDQRLEFVRLAESGSVSFAELCRRFGIKRDTGYKWLARYEVEGAAGLVDRSRRPRTSPYRTDEAIEALVCDVRRSHPAWGGRKIRGFLLRQGHCDVPAASTITAILRRNELLANATAPKRDFTRFERTEPNELWQMDFKGDFALDAGGRCHAFGLIDDYSRYSLCLAACANQRTDTVHDQLTATFTRYGLPEAMLMDNGSPWGNTWGEPWTPLTVWLCDLGIEVIHSRPFHPQTAGKKERLHLTLDLEVLHRQPSWDTLTDVQAAFDAWNPIYNHHRPHESLGETIVPADRYHPSPRTMPASIPTATYPDHWAIRTVAANCRISYQGTLYRIGKPFRGRQVAIAPTTNPDTYHVYYRHHHIKTLNLSTMSPNARP